MDAAVAALIGAGIGALVPFLDGIRRDHRDDARAAATRQDTREARLFDHRRTAYAAFVEKARADLNGVAEVNDWSGSLPEDALVPLAGLSASVALYGTPEADRRAQKVLEVMMKYAFEKLDEHNSYRQVDDAIVGFLAQARIDLGGPSV